MSSKQVDQGKSKCNYRPCHKFAKRMEKFIISKVQDTYLVWDPNTWSAE
jgi:hypothetical protein